MARSSLVIDMAKARTDDNVLREAAHDLKCCFLEGQKSRGEPWYPEMITLLTYTHNRVKRLRSEK